VAGHAIIKMTDLRDALPPAFPMREPKEALEAIGMKGLDVQLVSRPKPSGFYGFPNNFIEKALGVSGTSRNWNTVTTIVQRAGHGPSHVLYSS